MAHAITFKPKLVDPHLELMKRVDAAPKEHAEALLVAWDLLQTAHDQGLLDLAQGLIGGKDLITGKLAEAANLPQSISAIRNGIALARVLGSIDPDMLHKLARSLDEASQEQLEREKQAALHGKKATEEKAPSFWSLAKSALSGDARRGMGFGLKMLVALGRASKSGE